MISTVQKDLHQFKKLPKEKQMLIGILVILLFVASIVVGAYLSREQEPSATAPTTTEVATETTTTETQTAVTKPTTSLNLEPSELSLAVGKTEQITVTLSDLPVTAADIYLKYDSAFVEVSDLKNGTVFEKQTTNRNETTIDAKEGVIAYHGSVGLSKDAAASSTVGTVFTFNVKALKKTEATAISFITSDNKTKTALGGNNTLGTTGTMAIEIQ